MNPVIKFEFTNEFGDKFVQESPLWDDEMDDIDNIGAAMNQFLRLVSYTRKNDYIFMTDITENEWEYLTEALDQYRAAKAEKGEVEDEDD